MHLAVGSRRLAIVQVGPDFMILAEPVEIPPTRGELVVEIDGDEKRRTIYLPEGIRATDIQTPIASI